MTDAGVIEAFPAASRRVWLPFPAMAFGHFRIAWTLLSL